MPEVVVRLRGLKAHGHHGVEEIEKREGQDFEFDVDFAYEPPVGAGDSLTARVDYADVAEQALAIFGRSTRQTVETVAEEIADHLFARYRAIRALAVRIRKRPPGWRDRLGHVEVEVERRR